MDNAEQVLAIYEDMSALSGQMLSAARARDWEHLAALESRCAGHVRTLQAGAAPAPLAGPNRARKIGLIQKILADDRAIRDLTQPWLAELAARMANTRVERKLNGAYGAA